MENRDSTDLVKATPGAVVPSNHSDRPPGADRVSHYAERSSAESTRKRYARHWATFGAWCSSRALRPLPADAATVALYVAHLADLGRSVSNIEQHLAAVAKFHRRKLGISPTDDERIGVVMEGIRRENGRPPKKKAPIGPKDLARAFDSMPTTLIGIRNRAILSLGFASSLRRADIVKIKVEDLQLRPGQGYRVLISSGEKTDQKKKGREIAIHYGRSKKFCPVLATAKWLQLSGITSGYVFRSVDRRGRAGDGSNALDDKVVWRLVKDAAAAIGMDPKDFGGHSLRAGFVTEAERQGVKHISIMNQTGHQDINTMVGYARSANLFDDSATKKLY